MGKNTRKAHKHECKACKQVLDNADCEGAKCENGGLIRKVTRCTFGL